MLETHSSLDDCLLILLFLLLLVLDIKMLLFRCCSISQLCFVFQRLRWHFTLQNISTPIFGNQYLKFVETLRVWEWADYEINWCSVIYNWFWKIKMFSLFEYRTQIFVKLFIEFKLFKSPVHLTQNEKKNFQVSNRRFFSTIVIEQNIQVYKRMIN